MRLFGFQSPLLRRAFTMIELLATISIVAVIAVIALVYIGDYISTAQKRSDQQTLLVLNDALNRYKTQGGSLSALTAGASMSNVLTAMQTPVTWAGVRHQFLRTGTSYTAASLSALGSGAHFRFSRYGSFTDGNEYSSDILATYASAGYDVGDEDAYQTWLAQAMSDAETSNYLAFMSPNTTDKFFLTTKVANSGDKIYVWWGDGTTSEYSPSAGVNTDLTHTYSAAANSAITIVGKLTMAYCQKTDGSGIFNVDLTSMPSLTYIDLGWDSTGGIPSGAVISGDVTGMPLTYLRVGGDTTVTGDVSNMPLDYMRVFGFNTLTGDVGTLSSITQKIEVAGGNTLYGDISVLTNPPLISFGGDNTVSGDISALTQLTTLSIRGGNSTVTGSLDSLTSLNYLILLGNNAVGGNLNSSNLRYLYLGGSNTISASSLVNTTSISSGLSYYTISNETTFDQTQVDTILANFWANRDVAKSYSHRLIDINSSTHAAPSAAGYTTKANLQAYRSPNNDPQYSLWTVNTN